MKYGSKRGLLRALAKTDVKDNVDCFARLAKTDTMTTQKGVFARSGVTTE